LRERHIAAATLGSISGPFTGALARPSQADCWKFGWKLLPYCAGFVLVASFFQMLRLPRNPGAELFRFGTWVIGWLGWFGGGFLSLAYAFS
jgi:hypothetical protein